MITCKEIIERRKELWEESHDIEQDQEYVQAVADHILEHKEIRDEIQRYPEYLIEMTFVIVDKDKQTVPFFLNTVQQMFLDDLNQAIEDFDEGKRSHLKFLVLKGRQQGFTSVITAYQLACSLTKRNFAGFTLADDSENTETIFEDKAKFPYGQLPEQLRPTEKYNNRREFHFDRLNSRWRVATAGSKGVGRSKTLNFFHGSEAAFWDEIQSIMSGLGQAITRDSIQILETTANGYNEYKDFWDDNHTWENKFYPWWLTPEYTLPFLDDHEKREFIDQVEGSADEIFQKIHHLRKTEELTWEQLHWYYDKWLDLKDEVKQEYPCNANEAFLATGESIFNKEKVIERIDILEKAYKRNKPFRGSFVYRYENDRIVDNTIRLIQDETGPVMIYEAPQLRVPYVIGGDIAEGGADYSASHVLNNITGMQVAVWHGKTDTDLYAKQMYCLGKYYNTALISIETNFDTHPVKELQRLGYSRMFRREVIDRITNQKQDRYGFNTTTVTRPVIIDELKVIVREQIELINDIATLQEMITFVKNDKGKAEAMEGKHDDLIMSLAISYNARSQQSMIMEEEYEEEYEFETAFGNTGY